ncbi:BgTH12-03701 [Blumeria graminis f. sp. triticale]|nr:BgTH12-03701 [Blumeria graminis f. sp. triticale]
MNRRRG